MKVRLFFSTILMTLLLGLTAGCSIPPTDSSSVNNSSNDMSSTEAPIQSDSDTANSDSSSSDTEEKDEVIHIRTYTDLKNVTRNPNGHYVLDSDIDCMGGTLELGNFSGVLDGNGHSICNVKNEGNYKGGLFMRLEKTSVVKNIGFYNMETTISSLNMYHFAIAIWLEGTIENVSFHQGGIGTICAPFNIIEEGCQISNFVAYTKDVQSSGFFNSGKREYIQNPSNIYIFSNKGWGGPIEAATAYFETGVTGIDYIKTDVYKSLDFKNIFDCSTSGVWAMDFNLRIPLIKHATVSVM